MYREIVAASFRNEFVKSKGQVHLIAKSRVYVPSYYRFIKKIYFINDTVIALEGLIE